MNRKTVTVVVAFAAGYTVNGFLASHVIKKKDGYLKRMHDYNQNLLSVIEVFVPFVPESVRDAAQEQFAFQAIVDNFDRG